MAGGPLELEVEQLRSEIAALRAALDMEREARAARFSEPTVSDIHDGRWKPVTDRPPTPAGQGDEGMLQPATHDAASAAAETKQEAAPLRAPPNAAHL